MKKVYLFIVEGFEEIEALGTIDILRRAEIDVVSVSLEKGPYVKSARGIEIKCDAMFGDTGFSDARMLILPGGTVRINTHQGLKDLLQGFAEKKQGDIAAICAAPMVLGGLGLLKGKKATAYPGFEKYLEGAEFVNTPVAADGNIVTGRGPGLTINFALALVERLKGKQARDKVAEALLVY